MNFKHKIQKPPNSKNSSPSLTIQMLQISYLKKTVNFLQKQSNTIKAAQTIAWFCDTYKTPHHNLHQLT